MSGVTDSSIRVGAVVAVAVDPWVGSITNTGVVSAVSAFGELVLLVAVESLLHFVDESRHGGWFSDL